MSIAHKFLASVPRVSLFGSDDLSHSAFWFCQEIATQLEKKLKLPVWAHLEDTDNLTMSRL